MTMRLVLRSTSGQATVETIAVLPVLAVAVFAAAQLLAAGIAKELADHAAEAGAVAILEGADPAAAARAALPGWSNGRVEIKVQGRRVGVRLEPLSPLSAVGRLLTASADADAGPAS
jgi:hypothetical protein